MTVRTWDTFGGRDADQQGYRPSEEDLVQWAIAENFTPVQAQALLCDETVYSPSYRKSLTLHKEICANAVQQYSKKRKALPQLEMEQTPVVGMLKFQLNPMHLLVQKAFLAAKRTQFDKQAWAQDYFQVALPKTQKQLKQYLLLSEVQRAMPEDIAAAAEDAQLAWMTKRAVQELAEFVEVQLRRLGEYRITTGHYEQSTASTMVEEFRTATNHAMNEWCEANSATAHVRSIFAALGITVDAECECEPESDDLILHILAARDTAAGRPISPPAEYDAESRGLQSENWRCLEVEEIECLRSLDGDELNLRRAAIVTQQWLHLFDLDASPPTCSTFSPFASSFKVMLNVKGKSKTHTVKGAAWCPILGRDPIPLALLHNRLYSKNNIVLAFKQGGLCHVGRPTQASVAPGLDTAQQSRLGLAFWPAEYSQIRPPGSKQQRTKGKRGRPSNKPSDERAAKQQRTTRSPQQVALLKHVLTTLLTDGYVEADWKEYVEGPPSADATCQINERQIEIVNLQLLKPIHLPVMESMHRHKAFEEDAWDGMKCTLERLANEGSQAGRPDAGVEDNNEGDVWASEQDEDDETEYVAERGGLERLAPERELPEGWRAPSSAHRQVKAAEVQLRQGATLDQLRDVLMELFECLELDFEICESMNEEWAEAVPAMIRDIAIMPARTWAKYWKGGMEFLDWLVDPECQAGTSDAIDSKMLDDEGLEVDETHENPEMEAEAVIQNKLAARYVTAQRFLRFIHAHEKSKPQDADAIDAIKLSLEQIQETGKQFAVDIEDAEGLINMRKTLHHGKYRDAANACGYIQILQFAFAKGQYEDRVQGLWKQAIVRRVEKQKRRLTGFLNKIALKDSSYRHLQTLTTSDMRQMALGFLKVTERQDWTHAIRGGAMYFYCCGSVGRAEDSRNRCYADMYPFIYPPSGRAGASNEDMECICFSKDTGKTTSPTGHWEDVAPPLDVLAGRDSGYGLQRIFHNARTPYKSVTPATHGYQTDQARKRVNRVSLKNTYEPRSLVPNSLVAFFGTNSKWIEKAGWFADLGTFDRHYEKIHHPDFIAQLAGYIDRDKYVGELGIDPEYCEEFKAMVKSLWPWLQPQIEQLKEHNLSARKQQRDLGGVFLLGVFVILRRTWWQLAPLLEDEMPEHQLLELGFMQEAKFSGVWDRWVNVTRQYRHERAGMLKAAEGPVFSIAGLRPPHLIVARLLEPVHKALESGAEPNEVFHSQIWRFASDVLLDIPNCPVQLSEAVHALMGRDPPAQNEVGSPVRQMTSRSAHITESLEKINAAARVMRQRQQAELAEAQTNAASAPSNAPAATTLQPLSQADIFQQVSSQVAALASSSTTGLSTQPSSMQQMATAIAAAIVAPVVHVFQQQLEQEHADRRRLEDILHGMNTRLERMESKLDSNTSFYPLMALAMAQLCHSVNGLAQYMSTGHHSNSTRPGQLSPIASPRLMTSPARKQLQRQENARNKAKKQVAAAQERIDAQMPAGMPRATTQSASHSARAVLSMPSSGGMRTVYPGADGEEYWCKWKGRFTTLARYPSWEHLLTEWKDGITYSFSNRRTVPMERLERDLQEGVQKRSSGAYQSQKEPWRQGIKDRNVIRDRKILIYGMLQAELDGKDLKVYMAAHVERAEKVIKSNKSRGASAALLTQIERQFERLSTFKNPADFEETVLGWKLTDKVKSQAASKKGAPAYPPDGVGRSTEVI